MKRVKKNSIRISIEHAKNQEKIGEWGPKDTSCTLFPIYLFLFDGTTFWVSDLGSCHVAPSCKDVNVANSGCWETAKQAIKLQGEKEQRVEELMG